MVTDRNVEIKVSTSDESEVTLDSGGRTSVGLVFHPGEASKVVDVRAVDDNLLDGMQTVTIKATAFGIGYSDGFGTVDVTDYETLTVRVAPTSISEGGGETTGTVTRSNTDIANALVVTLTSSDTSEAVVPETVTIPANRASVEFLIHAVDDAEVDGPQKVAVTPSAPGYVGVSAGLEVLDDEAATLVLKVTPASVLENAGKGAITGRVTRNVGTESSLSLRVESSNTGEATVSVAVVIPKGLVTLTPVSAGFAAVAATLQVRDYETLTVTVEPSTISEGDGAGAATGMVTRGNTDRQEALVVMLAVNPLDDEARVPASVTIPAGEGSATFPIDAVDDLLADGKKTVTITASAPGYAGIADTVEVTDDDVRALTVEVTPTTIAETAGEDATTGTVTRNTEDNSVAMEVRLTSSDESEVRVPTFVTIPAGAASVTFGIDAVNDGVHDPTARVTITASATGFASGSATLEVTGECDLVVVTETNLGDWELWELNGAVGELSSEISFVVGPSMPPLGSCSVRLETGPGTGRVDNIPQGGKPALRLKTLTGRRLASIQAMSYSTYVSSSASPVLTSYLNIVLFRVTGQFAGTMVFEPYYSTTASGGHQPRITPGVWQTWDGRAGKWWFTRQLGNICANDCFVPFDEFLNQDPDLVIGALFVVAGQVDGGIWANFVGNVDNFTIALDNSCKTYDFECSAPP
ncbi:MAG: hypothetical protein HYU36_00370, partial [Planctomycetes bacterium]|nr:hypothetical protein [Planctomycetota bacterium]